MSSSGDIHEIDYTLQNTSNKIIGETAVVIETLQNGIYPRVELAYKIGSISDYGIFSGNTCKITHNPAFQPGEARNYKLTIYAPSSMNKNADLYTVKIYSLVLERVCTKCGAIG